MRDLFIGAVFSLVAIFAAWALAFKQTEENGSSGDQDAERYFRTLEETAAEDVIWISEERAKRLADEIRLPFREIPLEKIAERMTPGPWLDQAVQIPLRRWALIEVTWPILLLVVSGSIGAGMVVRLARIDFRVWRSPLAAFVAKKVAVACLFGFLVWAAIPFGMPVWVGYVCVVGLSVSGAAFVGMLGRI